MEFILKDVLMSSLFLYLILLILWGPPIFIHLIVQYFSYTELKCIHGGGDNVLWVCSGPHGLAFVPDSSTYAGIYHSFQWPHFQPQYSYSVTKSQIPPIIQLILFAILSFFIIILIFEILFLYIYRNWILNTLGEN